MTMPTLGQAIRDAIEAALAAARFHDDLAARTDDARARRFLQDMAQVEHVHGSEIASAGRAVLAGDLPDFAHDDAESIETLPEWREANNVTLDEALEITLACERKAGAHYAAWGNRFDGRAAEFFHQLVGAEADHERMIEQVLARRVASQRSRLPLPQIGRNIVEAELASARLYRNLAGRADDLRARRFFEGMADVQEVVAGDTERRVVELASEPLALKSNLAVTRFETIPGRPSEDGLQLAAAMRLSLAAERRSALVYRSMSRYVEGAEAELVVDIALAEDTHARSIEEALALL